MKHSTLILAIALLTLTACHDDGLSTITFHVHADTLPDGTTPTIYMASSLPQTGHWVPNGIALEPIGNDRYETSFTLPRGLEVEYKFTRGTWPTEAVDTGGSPLPNFALTVHGDTTVMHRVVGWRDNSAPPARQVTGQVEYIDLDMSKYDLADRQATVWLPPGYYDNNKMRYPVLYVHDGQNAFDPTTSAFGKDWQLDETADSLIRADLIEPIIMVAIPCSGQYRNEEYSQHPMGDRHRRYLAESLKPMIDRRYRTRSGPENNAVLGSSMGGLAAFITGWQHNETFGKVASFSPAFEIRQYSYVDTVINYNSTPKQMALYIDNGTEGLEAQLQPGIDRMMQTLDARNYDYEWYLDEGAEHNEPAWAARAYRPLIQFFGKGN